MILIAAAAAVADFRVSMNLLDNSTPRPNIYGCHSAFLSSINPKNSSQSSNP